MAKILSYKNKRNNLIIIISLAISIAITNSFIVFSPDEDSRFYFSNLTSTLTVGVPLVIAFVMIFRYKRSMKKQEEISQVLSQPDNGIHYYYDNNKMHMSICVFLVLWFVAHVIWTFQYQQASDVSIADALWFIGYGFFGYFLYSLYYHFFRKEFEPFILILMAIIIVIALVFVVDIIASTTQITVYTNSRYFCIACYHCLPNTRRDIDFSSRIDFLGSKKNKQQSAKMLL